MGARLGKSIGSNWGRRADAFLIVDLACWKPCTKLMFFLSSLSLAPATLSFVADFVVSFRVANQTI